MFHLYFILLYRDYKSALSFQSRYKEKELTETVSHKKLLKHKISWLLSNLYISIFSISYHLVNNCLFACIYYVSLKHFKLIVTLIT